MKPPGGGTESEVVEKGNARSGERGSGRGGARAPKADARR